ncbi:hypothetical protein NQ314_005662 [Rhamnusium bicolor]|uniref:Uncharacterized protein n=1 Tax=Rhamnusium bicolor TaxID=1586634 RepID=A0AAV8ZGB6_9CUCU|nr:hypothetical protein NQ314_005662 [Rhamnusium bicolor]
MDDFFTRLCRDTFGEKFNEAFISQQIGRTNMDYGALDINASNIVYVHGTYDPWHVIGLTETTNPESPVILING